MEFKVRTMKGIALFLRRSVLGALIGISVFLCLAARTGGGASGGEQNAVSRMF